MSIEEVEVVVVGGGQAGIALSEHLSNAGVPHVILERGRIAEKWRSGRWDSLVTNGPAWHDRFPGLEFDTAPDAFVPKEQVADYFEAYAKKIAAPVRCGVEVTLVRKNDGRPGFTVQTSDGVPRRPLRGRRDRTVPAARRSAGHPRRRRRRAAPLRRLPQPGAAPRGQRPRGRRRVLGRADRRRAPGVGPSGLPLRRPARPAAAPLPRAGQRLVARRPRQVGDVNSSAGRRARDHRGQRREGRPHRRLPRPRRPGHHPRRPDRLVQRRHGPLQGGPAGQHRGRRRELPLAARRGRRLRRSQRARPARGAGGPRSRSRPGLRDQPAARA